MKKLNLICASIAALVAVGSAQAGTATSTATKIAIENFGGAGANQDTIPVLGAPISYSMSNITAVNSGSTVYFTIRLSGGKFITAPTGLFTFAGAACDGAGGRPTCVVTTSTDKSTMKVAVTVSQNYTLGLGAFTYTPNAADIVGVNTTLAAAGGAVTATIGLVTLDPGTGTAIDATAAQQTIDSPLASGTLASGVKAINGVVGASTYNGQIDLTASPAGSAYTTATGGSTQAVLGSVTFTNVASSGAKRPDGTNNYALATNSDGNPNTGVTVVVTPGSGQVFPVGAVLKLSTGVTTVSGVDYPNCTATATGSTSTVTSANANAPKTLTTTDAVVTAVPIFVCMSTPTTGNTATPIQATLLATVAPSVNTNSIGQASGNGYNLQYNGSTVNVHSYWPGTLSPAFTAYLRVTNTGSVPADVTLSYLSSDDSSLLGTKKIATALAAGKTVLLNTKDIDALPTVTGITPAGYDVRRVRITAPTNGLRVQSMLQQGSGASAGVLVEFAN